MSTKQPEKSQPNRRFLLIDSVAGTPKVVLYKDCRKIDQAILVGDKTLSENLLILVDRMLKKNNLLPTDMTAILVNPGPGSYTGLRIGVTTANTLAFSLNIPILAVTEENIGQEIKSFKVKSNKFNCPVVPIYSQPPHITEKRDRL